MPLAASVIALNPRGIALTSTLASPQAAARAQTARRQLLQRCAIASLAVSLSMSLAACSWFDFLFKPHRSAVHASGSINVAPLGEFVYVPARDGKISPNRIANTAMSGIVMKTDIADTVRTSVIHALRLNGLGAESRTRTLSASIETFRADDERSPAVWTLTMRFVVRDATTREVIYDRAQTVKQKYPKFSNNAMAIDGVVKASVDALTTDPEFAKALK